MAFEFFRMGQNLEDKGTRTRQDVRIVSLKRPKEDVSAELALKRKEIIWLTLQVSGAGDLLTKLFQVHTDSLLPWLP
jgi:hypothetical protein